MSDKKIRQHTIDFIFPIALFFVFAASSLVVLLLSANIYRSITEDSRANFTSGTSLSYVTEKIRQSDENGPDSIRAGSFDGHPALVMEHRYPQMLCYTYIYEADGSLRELFVQDGIDASAEDGTKIMDLRSFRAEDVGEGLIRLTCTYEDGHTESALVGLRSECAAVTNGGET